MEALQIYWWFIISLLGGLLVFLLFVQGGQSFLATTRNSATKDLIVNALGRKWELTFTTLVVFGGAYFASFPLYYSTSFGGAYWLWMLILFSFILQAVSYEFRRKPGNLFGTRTYDIFLTINGGVGTVLLGCAVAMQFFGADFEISRQNILDPGAPVISVWNSWHGFAEIFAPLNLLLGFAVFFLARMLGIMFIYRNVHTDDEALFTRKCFSRILSNGIVFLILFLAFLAFLFTAQGFTQLDNGEVAPVSCKYFWNMIDLWWIGVAFLVGVVMVLYALVRVCLDEKFRNQAFWWAAIGVVIVVTSLFCISGYNNTSFLPSTTHLNSSLFLTNASSSEFTLKVMAWVTVLLPFVVGYIAYVWHKLTDPAINTKELAESDHNY